MAPWFLRRRRLAHDYAGHLHPGNARHEGQSSATRYGASTASPMLSIRLTGWVSTDTMGLDVGMILLSAENLRSGNVWKWFMANPEPRRAMKLAGIEKS